MFKSLFFRSEREKEERNNDDSLLIQIDIEHSHIVILHRLQSKHYRKILSLLIRSQLLYQHNTLRVRLRETYKLKYDMHNMYEFGFASII